MNNLTDDERRQIYEEEEQKENERRRPRRRRPDKVWLAIIAFLAAGAVLTTIVGDPTGVGRALARNEAEVRAAGKYPTAPPDTFLPTPVPTPATGIRTSFGDGVWLIGDQIAPGTYRASSPSSACYWARFAATSDVSRLDARSAAATDSGTWSGGLTPRVELAWVRDTDAVFETIGCGTWRRLAE